MMFSNRHMQVKMVKDNSCLPPSIDNKVPYPLLLDFNMIMNDNFTKVVKGVVAVIVVRKVMNTACELVLIKAGK